MYAEMIDALIAIALWIVLFFFAGAALLAILLLIAEFTKDKR